MSRFIEFDHSPYKANCVSELDVQSGLRDARRAWAETRNIAMATVGPDGPHSTVLASGLPQPKDSEPVFASGLQPDGTILFWSFPDSEHAINIETYDNRAAFSVYSSERNMGALTIKATVERISYADIDYPLAILNAIRKARGVGPPKSKQLFDPLQESPQALYAAHPRQITIGVRGFMRQQKGEPVYSSNVAFPVTVDDIWSV